MKLITPDAPVAIIEKIILNKSANGLKVNVYGSLGLQRSNATATGAPAFPTPGGIFADNLDSARVMLLLTTNTGKAAQFLSLREDALATNFNLIIPNGYTSETYPLRKKIITLREMLCNKEINPDIEFSHVSLLPTGTLVKVPFSATFEMPDLYPGFLAFFAVPFTSSNPNSSKTATNVAFGKLSSEVIVTGGNVKSVSTLFKTLDPDGNVTDRVWIGNVHRRSLTNPLWYTGVSDIGGLSGIPLQASAVQNIKISDLRSTGIWNGAIEMKKTHGAAATKLNKILNRGRNTQSYISDVNYTVNGKNQLCMSFSFDYLSAIKDNSGYAPLYNNDGTLLGSCGIVSMELIRKRVNNADNVNKLTGGASPNRMIGHETVILRRHPTRIRLRESSGNAIMHYIATDMEMRDVTFGIYEYGVRIKVLDGTRSLLMQMSRQIDNSLSRLRSFLKISLLPQNYGGRCDGGGDYMGTYSNKFISDINSTPPHQQIWRVAMLDYIALLSLILPGQVSPVTLAASLGPIVDPTIAGPSGITFLVKMIEDFSGGVKRALKIPAAKAPHANQTTAMATSHIDTNNLTFDIEENFKTVFDADSIGNYGFEFLARNKESINLGLPSVPAPIKVLSYNGWRSLVNNEIQKAAPFSMSMEKAIFLTPNFIKLPNEIVDISQPDIPSNKIFKSAAAQILRANAMKQSTDLEFNLGRAPLMNDVSDINYEDMVKIINEVDVINHRSARLELLNDDNLASETIFDIPNTLDANQVLQEDNLFVTETDDEFNAELMDQGVSATGVNILSEVNIYNTDISSYVLENDFFNGFEYDGSAKRMKSINSQNYLKNTNINLLDYETFINENIPLGTAAPQERRFVEEMKANHLSPEDLPLVAFRYGTIYKVEYWGDGVPGAAGSGWAPLTPEIVNTREGTGLSLLCRLRKHQTYLANFEGLRMPIYNEIFFISDGGIGVLPQPGISIPPGGSAIPFGATTYDPNVLQFANSYINNMSVGYTVPAASSTTPIPATSGQMFQQLAGQTSYNTGHEHAYTIDNQGNGIANEACHPALPGVCHTHKIINGVIQSGESNSINPQGAPPHIHSIPSAPPPAPVGPTGQGIASLLSPGALAQGGPLGGGSGQTGGGAGGSY